MDVKTKRKWIGAVFIGAACAGLLVGLLLQRNAYVNKEQRCEKLYADAWKLFGKNKIEDGALALNVLFTSMPSCELAADAGYFSGVIKEFYTRETQKAVEIFRTVADRYPETPAAKKALEKITIYDTDDYEWYKEKAHGKALGVEEMLATDEGIVLSTLHDIYGDEIETVRTHLGFLYEGARILNDSKKQSECEYLKGLLFKASGTYKSALRILSKLASKKSSSLIHQSAILHVSDIFFRRKAYADALATLSQITATDEELPYVKLSDYGRAEIYFSQKNYEKAASYYRRVVGKMKVLPVPFYDASAPYPEPELFSVMDPEIRLLQCDFFLGNVQEIIKDAPALLTRVEQETIGKKNLPLKNLIQRKRGLASFLLSASYEVSGRPKDATKFYEQVLQIGMPPGDPDNIFPQTLFSAGRLYFQQKNYGKAQQLLTQFDEEYPENENVTDAKAYRLLSLEKSGKAGGTVETVESFIESVKDSGLSFALYYASVQKRQVAEKEELPSARDLLEEAQAKRFYESVMKKALSLPVKPVELLVMLGDMSFYAGNEKKAMTYFKDALQGKNAAGIKQGFETVQTFSAKPETVAAYLKKCVQREKARALEKKIEARDSAPLRAALSRAYAEIGWTESAFLQWKQAAMMDLQTVSSAYLENMKSLVSGIAVDAEKLFSENTFLSEGAELEAETAKLFYEKLLYNELLLRTGLEARFPPRREELEKMAGAPVNKALWDDFLSEKRFYIPASETFKSLQENFADMLRSFRENETVTGELLNGLKSQCGEMLSRIQEEKEG